MFVNQKTFVDSFVVTSLNRQRLSPRRNATAGEIREERVVVEELEMFNQDYNEDETFPALYIGRRGITSAVG